MTLKIPPGSSTTDKGLQDTRLNQNSVALQYTDDKQAEKEIREISPFTIVTNNIKISWGNCKCNAFLFLNCPDLNNNTETTLITRLFGQ